MPDLFPVSKRRSAISKVLTKSRRIYNNIVKLHPTFDVPPSHVPPLQRIWNDSASSAFAPTPTSRLSACGNRSQAPSPSSGGSNGSFLSCRSTPSPHPGNYPSPYLMTNDTTSSAAYAAREHPAVINRKHRSLSHLEQIKLARLRTMSGSAFYEGGLPDEDKENESNESNASRLRRIKGNITSQRRSRPKSESLLCSDSSTTGRWSIMVPSHQPSSQNESSLIEINPQTMTAPDDIHQQIHKSLSPIIEQDSYSVHTLDSSFASVPRTTFASISSPPPAALRDGDPPTDAATFLDQSSGIQRQNKGFPGQIADENPFDLSITSTTPLSLNIDSPPPVGVEDMDSHMATLPSFALTIPTPESSHLPVFEPQSPFTVERFVEASEASLDSTGSQHSPPSRRQALVPVLPRCNHQDGGGLCDDCDTQMLACKMWFQDSDAGRRQSLREPFIKPAESNAVNRAVMEALGISSGSPTKDATSAEPTDASGAQGSRALFTIEEVPANHGQQQPDQQQPDELSALKEQLATLLSDGPIDTERPRQSRRLVARGKEFLQNLASLRRRSLPPTAPDYEGEATAQTQAPPTSFLTFGNDRSNAVAYSRRRRVRPRSSIV